MSCIEGWRWALKIQGRFCALCLFSQLDLVVLSMRSKSGSFMMDGILDAFENAESARIHLLRWETATPVVLSNVIGGVRIGIILRRR